MVIIHKPRNTNPQIVTIWAFVSVDDGGEGIVAALVGGVLTPLVTSEERHLPMLRKFARDVGRRANSHVRLIKLTGREVIEELPPDG